MIRSTAEKFDISKVALFNKHRVIKALATQNKLL